MSHSRRSFLVGVPAVTATAMLAPALLSSASAQTPYQFQSPINIRTDQAVNSPHLPALRVHYPTSVDLEVSYESRGDCGARSEEETVEAFLPAGSGAHLTLGSVRYDLIRFHFHIPAEHQINGRTAPMEQHYVHSGPNGETLVLGLFLTGGGYGNLVQDRILGNAPVECGPHREVAHGNVAASLPGNLSTYRYTGSLTTSPFGGPVSWLVLNHSKQISHTSIDKYAALFPNSDNRDPQPLNGRTVRYRGQ